MNLKLKQSVKRKFWRPWMLPVAVILVGFLEVLILVLIGANSSFWWALGIVLAGFIIGLALLLAAGQQSISRLISIFRAIRGTGDLAKHFSRPVFTLLAAFLFFFPGLLTDLMAIVLLFTPVQKQLIKQAGFGENQLAGRRLSFGSSRNVIQGEVIIDATEANSPAPNPAAKKKTPPALEGDVL